MFTKHATSTNSALFKTRENTRLNGHVVKQFLSPSLMSCNHWCLRNSWCTSTNFRELSEVNKKGTCELNKHGYVDQNTNLDDQKGVTFSLLVKVHSSLVKPCITYKKQASFPFFNFFNDAGNGCHEYLTEGDFLHILFFFTVFDGLLRILSLSLSIFKLGFSSRVLV